MRNYIVTAFLSIVILGKLIGIINIFLGRYQSIFVSYFTIAPIDSYQINDIHRDKQKKFKILAILSGLIDILLSVIIILVISKVETDIILLLAFLIYANSTFFSKYSNQILQLN